MSDNPNEEELASLGILFDSQAFINEINAAKQEVVDLGTLATQSMQQASTAAEAFTEAINQAGVSAQSVSDKMNAGFSETAQMIRNMRDELDTYRDAAGTILPGGEYGPGAVQVGYGAEGGMIGPAEAPEGGFGSLFGAAHGLRAASGLARLAGAGTEGTQAITGGADVLYLVQGFRSISDILPTLNSAIEQTPGLLAPLVEGFAAMGVEMAGVAALAAPVAAVAVSIAGVVAVMKLLQQQADLATAGLERDVKNEDERRRITGESTDKATQDLNDYQQKIADAQTKVKDIQAQQQQAITDLLTSRGVSLEEATGNQQLRKIAAGDLSRTTGGQDAQKQIDDLNKSITQWQDLVNKSFVDIQNGSTAAADAIEKHVQAAADVVQQEKDRQALDKLSSEQAQAKLAQLKDEATALQASNAELGKTGSTSKEITSQITANNAALADNAYQQQYLTSTVIPATQALDNWNAHEKDLQDTLKAAAEVAKQRAEIEKQIATEETQVQQQRESTLQKEAQNEQQYLQGSLQDSQQRTDIAEKESRKETEIKLQAYQTIADLGTKLSENEQKAAAALDRQLQDDGIKYAQTRSKMIREEQDQESQDLTDHLRKLADIQNQQHQSDQQALLDRNFLQLAKNQQSNTQQIEQENQRYAQQVQDQRTHLAQQEREQDIARTQEEAQQRLAYQRKFSDLQTQYDEDLLQQHTAEQRKLDAARTAERQSLQDLTTNEQYRIQLLRQGMQQELDLLKQQEQAKLALLNQSLTNLGGAGNTTATYSGRSAVSQFAGGGDFDAGQPFVFNEAGSSGNERVRIGSSSFGSSAAALVIPFGSGSVDKGGGQPIQLFNTWNIYESNNPDATVNLAIGKMQDMLEAITQR